MKLALILLLLAAPVHAVTLMPGVGKPVVKITEIRAEIALGPEAEGIRAEYSCFLRLENPGANVAITLSLPKEPAAQLKLGSEVLTAVSGQDRTEWTLNLATGSTELTCAWQLVPRKVSHLHVLGQWRVAFPLQRLRGFAAYPDAATLAVRWNKLDAALFGAPADATNVRFSHAISREPAAFTFEWFGATVQQRLAQVVAQRDAISDVQRNHDNRAYTEALVTLAELHALKNDHAAVAAVCATLMDLEAAAGRAITHCGPWAKWRKHVPWALRRVAALRDAGNATEAAAKAAVKATKSLWSDYQSARTETRPFEHFSPERNGNYWDYDWPRVRELLARALELAGEPDRAAAVRNESGE